MPDFIAVDEINEYNNLLTYFTDLKENKKASFVYKDDNLLKRLSQTIFVNEKAVQPILFEKAYEKKWHFGEIFLNILDRTKFQNILSNLSTLEQVLSNKTVLKEIFANEEITLFSLVGSKTFFKAMCNDTLYSCIIEDEEIFNKIVDFEYEMIGLGNFEEFLNNDKLRNYAANKTRFKNLILKKPNYRYFCMQNPIFRTDLAKNGIDYRDWDLLSLYFVGGEQSKRETSYTNSAGELFFLKRFGVQMRTLDLSKVSYINIGYSGGWHTLNRTQNLSFYVGNEEIAINTIPSSWSNMSNTSIENADKIITYANLPLNEFSGEDSIYFILSSVYPGTYDFYPMSIKMGV